jgi:hypothetical protein
MLGVNLMANSCIGGAANGRPHKLCSGENASSRSSRPRKGVVRVLRHRQGALRRLPDATFLCGSAPYHSARVEMTQVPAGHRCDEERGKEGLFARTCDPAAAAMGSAPSSGPHAGTSLNTQASVKPRLGTQGIRCWLIYVAQAALSRFIRQIVPQQFCKGGLRLQGCWSIRSRAYKREEQMAVDFGHRFDELLKQAEAIFAAKT